MILHLKMRLRTYFVTGLLTILPIVVTLYIIKIGINLLDRLCGSPFAGFIERYGFPGVRFLVFGIELICALIIIILVGFFMTIFIGRGLLNWGEEMVNRLPIISKIYNAVKQFIETIFLKGKGSFTKVVLVEYPRKGIYSIGFVTSKTEGEIQEAKSDELINVFVPTTPNPTSGMLIFVPKDEAVFLNMSIEEGIKLIVSGGILVPSK